MAACTIVLIVGIQESATTNAVLVAVKVGVVLFVIGCRYSLRPTRQIRTSMPVEDRLDAPDMGEFFRRHPELSPNDHPNPGYSAIPLDGCRAPGCNARPGTPRDAHKLLTDDEKIRHSRVDTEQESAKVGRHEPVGPQPLSSNRSTTSFAAPSCLMALSGIMVAAAAVFFAYLGFDAISTHSEEAKKPQRDVPIGILTSLGVCTVLYFGVSAVITGMEPYPTNRSGCGGRRCLQALAAQR